MQVHVVPLDEGRFMLDTGGLSRFGLESLVVMPVNRATIESAGALVNALAPRLVEGQRPAADGTLRLVLDGLQAAPAREAANARKMPNGTGVVTVGFREPDVANGARPEPVVVDCPGGLDAALKSLFGSKDETRDLVIDEKVKAAQKRARALLQTFKPEFEKGLPYDEVLMVKVPFKHPRGTESMWVDVHGWAKGVILGTLENEPRDVSTVKAGDTVEVNEADVTDVMYRFKDGTFLGNEVGRATAPESFQAVGDGRWRSLR